MSDLSGHGYYFKIQTDPPNMSGPLRKQGRRLGIWVTRYFRVEWESSPMHPTLAIYNTESMVERHDVISLARCYVRSCPNKDVPTAKGGAAYCLELETSHSKDGRVYVLYAASEEEREEWVDVLQWSALNCNIDNGYDIDRETGKLGSGAFSTVWKGIHRQTGRAWAIKEMVKNSLQFQEEENLREEIKIQRIVGEHSNIVYMKEFVETCDRYYIVVDLLDRGALLDRIMDAGKFTEKDALYIMKQLLNALGYLHDKNIVHRDLKPENFLLTDEPPSKAAAYGATFAFRVCIGDFGLASYCTEPDSLTHLCGSPGYVAPEVIKEKEGYGLPVDMWSMGVNLYILLTGIPPFAGATDKESFALTIKGKIKWSPLHECSPTLRDLISRMLTYNPAKRITAAEAIDHPWMTGEGVGDRQLRIKDNLRSITSSVRDKGEKMTELAAKGFAAMLNTAAALTSTVRTSRDLPSTSWMGGHGKTTPMKEEG